MENGCCNKGRLRSRKRNRKKKEEMKKDRSMTVYGVIRDSIQEGETDNDYSCTYLLECTKVYGDFEYDSERVVRIRDGLDIRRHCCAG